MMTDKTTYTVTMQVEVEAEGPARAVRQALDWARDTQSQGGVIDVKPGTLAALQASQAAQRFTGPVDSGAIMWQPKPAGVDPKEVRALAKAWRDLARTMDRMNVAFNPAKAERVTSDINRLEQCAYALEALTHDL